MELQFRSIRPGQEVERELISLPGAALPQVESDAVGVGDLLWIGGQLAADASGPTTGNDVESQLDYIFDRISHICEEGGTSISELLRIRAFVTDESTGYRFYSKLKERVPVAPPAASVVITPDPLHVEGCSVLVDAVCYRG
jgi:enamine deaminase RidA (YjgF/YER057c/UK114 family)